MEPLSEQDYRSLVRARLGAADFELVSADFYPSPGAGSGPFADYTVLRISVKLKSSADISEVSFVVKRPPAGESCREFAVDVGFLEKEARVYDALRECGGCGVAVACATARCDAIVLENLLDLGYRRTDRHLEFGLQQCELVLDALARLHAASLVLEKTRGKTVTELFPETRREPVFPDATEGAGFDFMCAGINALEALFTTHFDNFPGTAVAETLSLLRNLPFRLRPSEDFRNTLGHGGVTADDALFAYGVDGAPMEARLWNFNEARYAPPALDVLLALHLTTSRAFRELHQGALLTHYYSRLAAASRPHGLDLADVLPWAEFEASVRYHTATAVGLALMRLHLSLLPANSGALTSAALREDRAQEVLSAYSSDERYRRRLGQAASQALEFAQYRGRRRSSVYISS